MGHRLSFCLAIAFAALGPWAAPAHADVMEIGAGGYSWVAGGPRMPVVEPVARAEVEQLGGDSHPASCTTISDTAGPAQWQPRVAQLAAKYDISPTLLEAVIWQESRWNTRAVSPVGARGLAQLMPGTARQMGVDPHDPNANLEGGARYLRLQLDAFGGDLEKALAAYNAGPGRVQRAGGIPAIRETQLYVASILARLSAPVRR